MVNKKKKLKIWGFEHDIQGVQNWFLLQTTTFYALSLKFLSFNVSIMKKLKEMFISEAFM